MPEHAQLPGGHLGPDFFVIRLQPLDHAIHAQILVIARHDLVRAALRSVEQDEVLDDVEQPLPVQHAVKQDFEQRLILRRLRVILVQSLPAVEMLLGRSDRPVLRIVAVGNHHQRVPVEQVRDGVLVIREVLLVGAVDVHLEALQLDEHQRQTIDEAHQVRPPQPQLAAHPQLAHRQIAVVVGVVEVDQAQPPIHQTPRSVAEFHRHPVAQQRVLLLVLRHRRLGDVVLHHLRQRQPVRLVGQTGIQPPERRQQLARQHHLGVGRAAEQTLRPEVLLVVRQHALPAELFGQQFGGRFLNQNLFGVILF